ncbi:hypothetical protein AB1K32_02510 [Metabacillus dongyingensis]|uniref:hypothetical protein n=1 Tax=Metabacillus dongyingensis TaxID=2874282 RepID=UPI003B8B3018
MKNYERDFYLERDKWYSSSKLEIKNPLLQLKRNESLFRRLLQENNFKPILYLLTPNFTFIQLV